MSLLGIVAAAVVPGGGIGVWIATRVFGIGKVMGALGNGAKAVAGLPWSKIWWIVPLGAALIFGLIENGNARHEHKLNVAQGAVIAAVKAEVDRGVGQPTRADQAPIWIRRFVDNVNVLDAAVKRQNAAIAQEHVADAKAQADAHVGGQTTPDQKKRGDLQRRIGDLANQKQTPATAPDEWSQM